MSEIRVEIKGLDEIRERMRQFPQKWAQVLSFTFRASLLKVWELIPPYPPEPPESTYIRTGTLGRSLGSSEAGGHTGGSPDIFEIDLGQPYSSASFGTRLEYAPYVIGEQEQAQVHQGRWWTMLKLANISKPHILRLFERMRDTVSRWLDGR